MAELTREGEVLAVAVSYERVIEDGQRLSFGTAFAVDMPRAEKNRILDDLADLAERQRARARRPKVVDDLRKHRETLAQFQEDAGRAEANWPVERAKLEYGIAEAEDEAAHAAQVGQLKAELGQALDVLRGRRAEEFNGGMQEWMKGGNRSGAYEPRGHRKANIERLDADLRKAEETAKAALEQIEYDRLVRIDEARKALAKAEAERQVVVGNYDVSLKRYAAAIESLEAELAEIDGRIGD